MHLLAITPGEGFDPKRWEPVLQSGIDALLIREPDLARVQLEEIAAWCHRTAPEVALWIRGLALPGCGVHLPESWQGDPPKEMLLSRPLHAPSQWGNRHAADQLLISPVFETPGKGPAWGPEALHRFLDELPMDGPRVLALGGVSPGNAGRLRHPRLQGLAAIRPFWGGDPAVAVRAFRAAI